MNILVFLFSLNIFLTVEQDTRPCGFLIRVRRVNAQRKMGGTDVSFSWFCCCCFCFNFSPVSTGEEAKGQLLAVKLHHHMGMRNSILKMH